MTAAYAPLCEYGGPETPACHDVSACGCRTALAAPRSHIDDALQPAPPDTAQLMVACNTWAQVADSEASRARQARNRLIRDLYADGQSARSLADMLDGVSVRMVYTIINESKGTW